MNIALIPARGGSKRIPRKNIKEFCGKPMIAWTIEAAINSRLFDRVIVSTDDAEIAEVSRKYGAEAPFKRPEQLSDDYCGTTEVVAHAAEWVVSQQLSVNAICCMYATAPFLQVADLKKGLEKLISGTWAYVFSATDYPASVFRSFTTKIDGGVEMIFPEYFFTRSQDLPETFHDAGQFYWGTLSAWLNKERIFDKHSDLVHIPRWRVQDIDTLDDWKRAEMIHNILREGGR